MLNSELQNHLKKIGVVPNKVLGQNFLLHEETSRWIVDQLDITREDVVVEVGPGMGALTEHLAGKPRRLILLEKDTRLAGWLRKHYAKQAFAVEVIEGDAAQYDFRPLFLEGPVKLIGNLPYSGATEIMMHFLRAPTPVHRAVLMLQREVAERICAEPGTKAYGVLSLILQRLWLPEMLRVVDGTIFHPRPEVDSAIIRLNPRPPETLAPHSPDLVEDLVRKGFAQRRKQLHNNLTADKTRWEETCSAMGLPLAVRGEALSLEQWIALANHLDTHPCARSTGTNPAELFDVVDEHDHVIGQEQRSLVHAQKLRHRAVHVFLFNREGELYLQCRSPLKDSHPLKWDSSASGHLDAGESYEDAAVRELGEELLVRLKDPLELIGSLPAGPGTDQEFVKLFRGHWNGPVRVHTSEILHGGFFPPALVREWIESRPQDFARGFIECFNCFQRRTPDRE